MNSPSTHGSVMVGVDGSEGSDLALVWAATYAQARLQSLAIVHAVTPPMVTDLTIDGAVSTEDLLRGGSAIVSRALEQVRTNHPSVDVTSFTAVGDPRSVLAEKADDATILVLGSRGRGTVASLLLGSVGVALAACAPCPVVVVRPHSDTVAPLDLPVVVGVDGSEASTDALTFGFELASSQHRPLTVLQAHGTAWLFPYPDTVSPELVRESTAAAGRLLDVTVAGSAEKFPDVVVRRHLADETPTQALVDASAGASVVVVGCRGRSAVQSRLLGSVSRAVLEHAHGTVAVVRSSRT